MGQLAHQRVKVTKALVARLTLDVTEINLLDHNSNLESCERFVECVA